MTLNSMTWLRMHMKILPKMTQLYLSWTIFGGSFLCDLSLTSSGCDLACTLAPLH